MADRNDDKYKKSADALIFEINRIKAKLIAKHGPEIAKEWKHRARRSTVINEYLGME